MNRAFTLIETLVVISIIALLVGLTFAGGAMLVRSQKATETESAMQNMLAVQTEIVSQRGSFIMLHARAEDSRCDIEPEMMPLLSATSPSCDAIYRAAGFNEVDVDGDGLPEVADAWGNVIRYDQPPGAMFKQFRSAGPDGVMFSDDDLTTR